jgi:type I restriction enzyme S subunit
VSWKEATLGQLCDDGGGEVKTGPFGSQLHQSDYSDHGTPVVMPKDIILGRVSEDGIARVGADHVERLAHHRLRVGDIVYGRRGDIGRCALVTETEAGWLCGTGCLRVTLGEAEVDPQFLFYFVSGAPFTRVWRSSTAAVL